MAVYFESGFVINLPDGQHFRFSNCKEYKEVSHLALKEMDFGWWEEKGQKLYLLEVKDYTVKESAQALPSKLGAQLVAKGVDSLLLLLSVWVGAPFGKRLSLSLPPVVRQFPNSISLIFVINVKQEHLVHLGALKDFVIKELRGRASIVNAKVELLDKERALQRGLPIT